MFVYRLQLQVKLSHVLFEELKISCEVTDWFLLISVWNKHLLKPARSIRISDRLFVLSVKQEPRHCLLLLPAADAARFISGVEIKTFGRKTSLKTKPQKWKKLPLEFTSVRRITSVFRKENNSNVVFSSHNTEFKIKYWQCSTTKSNTHQLHLLFWTSFQPYRCIKCIKTQLESTGIIKLSNKILTDKKQWNK